MSSEPRIGDFSQPVVPPPLSRSPVEDSLKAAERAHDEAAQRDEAALGPMVAYEKRLEKNGISRAKAAEIVDAVLLKGYYAEDITVTKGISVRLRTRAARDTQRAQAMIENLRLTYDKHYHDVMGRYILAASLEKFGADSFAHPQKGTKPDEVEAMYRQRLDYVESLGEPALLLLLQKLAKFDTMIIVVLEEGAIENF